MIAHTITKKHCEVRIMTDMPRNIAPMLAKAGYMPAEQADYAFEIKWDGIRAILYYDGKKTLLLSRNRQDITAQYPEVASFQPGPAIKTLVIDGEIIATDPSGRPSFSNLQHRMGVISPDRIRKLSYQIPVTLVIFDVLFVNGRELFDLPYHQRRKLLEELDLSGPSWHTPAVHIGSGDAMLQACVKLGLEGIIAKRLESKYLPGKRPGTWLKIKNQLRQELVIGGWAPGQGTPAGKIGALLVGYYDITQSEAKRTGRPQRLKYAGAVGTGYSEAMLNKLADLLDPLQRTTNPFSEPPPKSGVTFVEPKLVGEFEFTEWTPNNTLRHPSFKGLRFDKNPKDIVREPTAK
ncbi:MAG: non-homologous end-joining DNA ligase [Negativicutes bacterium]|nr:non-homologous end-joining DNA ligase [Negativicutes bacterium]